MRPFVFFLLSAMALLPTKSISCTCPEATLDQVIEGSDFVFRASINGAIVTNPSEKSTRVRIFYSNLIPLKGGAPPFGELFTLDSGLCGVEISVPQDYWIFVGADGFISRCARPRRATDDEVRILEFRANKEILEYVGRKRAAVQGVDVVDARKRMIEIIVFVLGGIVFGILLARFILSIPRKVR